MQVLAPNVPGVPVVENGRESTIAMEIVSGGVPKICAEMIDFVK